MPAEEYNVGCYLLQRLVEIGCGHLFGVPGDYNLRFLDDVMAQEGLEWVGCANELNAAYAADGYARCRRIAAVLTTYGVGELSAVNGIAGAYSERNPVIHIVGGPAIKDEHNHLMMHHTLGDGLFQHFSLMSEQISCVTARLTEANALTEIDRVIRGVLYHKKPGYILLPKDVADAPAKPPTVRLAARLPEFSEESLAAFIKAVEIKVSAAKRPAALVGYLCDRFLCHAEAQALVEDAHIPFAHMLLGKGTLNEQSEHYIGCYFGATCDSRVRLAVEEADLCVMMGVKFHDFGTGYFTQNISPHRMIDIQPFESVIDGRHYPQLPMSTAIKAVHEIAMKHCASWPHNVSRPPAFPMPESDAFSMRHFWNEIQDGLAPGDIVVVDQGTSSSAGAGLVLPKDGKCLVQCLWGSIGYSLPAAFGAQLAEPHRRVILAVGDGSAQMTIQELGSFMRRDLRPIVFLVNNDGYVIERVIHGWNAEYNDIASWNWCALAKAMSTTVQPDVEVVSESGKTRQMMKETQKHRDHLIFREVMLGRHELPVVSLGWKPN